MMWIDQHCSLCQCRKLALSSDPQPPGPVLRRPRLADEPRERFLGPEHPGQRCGGVLDVRRRVVVESGLRAQWWARAAVVLAAGRRGARRQLQRSSRPVPTRLMARLESNAWVRYRDTEIFAIGWVRPLTAMDDPTAKVSGIGSGVLLSKSVEAVPNWVTVMICPPWIVSVPVRVGPRLAESAKTALPGPVPAAGRHGDPRDVAPHHPAAGGRRRDDPDLDVGRGRGKGLVLGGDGANVQPPWCRHRHDDADARVAIEARGFDVERRR